MQDEDNAEHAESVSSLSEEESEVEENSDDDAVNIFDMSAHAKRVSWGAPERENSESSQSSGGVLVHGRGAINHKINGFKDLSFNVAYVANDRIVRTHGCN